VYKLLTACLFILQITCFFQGQILATQPNYSVYFLNIFGPVLAQVSGEEVNESECKLKFEKRRLL